MRRLMLPRPMIRTADRRWWLSISLRRVRAKTKSLALPRGSNEQCLSPFIVYLTVFSGHRAKRTNACDYIHCAVRVSYFSVVG